MYVRNRSSSTIPSEKVKRFVSGTPGRVPDTKLFREQMMSTAMMSSAELWNTMTITHAVAPGRTVAPGSTVGTDRRSVNRTGPSPRLRITQRGRSLLMAVAVAPLVIGVLLFAVNGGEATASLNGSGLEFQYVTVTSGETLWQLAVELAPTSDPREVIDEIVKLNQLESSDVFAGQELAVPARYVQK
jgi:LysM repeat protein